MTTRNCLAAIIPALWLSSYSPLRGADLAALVAACRDTPAVAKCAPVESHANAHAADSEGALAQFALGVIAWEHKVLPSLVGHVPHAPNVPANWPEDRFDLVWVLDRTGSEWSFAQLPQMLLAGDSAEPIK